MKTTTTINCPQNHQNNDEQKPPCMLQQTSKELGYGTQMPPRRETIHRWCHQHQLRTKDFSTETLGRRKPHGNSSNKKCGAKGITIADVSGKPSKDFTQKSPDPNLNTQAQCCNTDLPLPWEMSQRDNDHSQLSQAGDRCHDDKVIGLRYLSLLHRSIGVASSLPSSSHYGNTTLCSCTSARSFAIIIAPHHPSNNNGRSISPYVAIRWLS